jgi:hypothetical protein
MGALSGDDRNRNQITVGGIRQACRQIHGHTKRRYRRRHTSAYTKTQIREKWQAIHRCAGATIYLGLLFAIVSLRAHDQGGFAWSFHLLVGIGFALLLVGPFLYESIEALYEDNNWEDAEGNLISNRVKANGLKAIAYTSIVISLCIVVMNWDKFTNPYIPSVKNTLPYIPSGKNTLLELPSEESRRQGDWARRKFEMRAEEQFKRLGQEQRER